MTGEKTREPQYQAQVSLRDTKGLARLGLTTNQVWEDDPRRLLFVLARYKFVSKMLSGKRRALEIGCGDAFGTRVVQQEVGEVTAIDFDPVFVEDVKSRMDPRWRFECRVHDMMSGPVPGGPYDAAYSLDVIEHIPRQDEDCFVSNAARSLTEQGVLIVGSPSIQSQAYASKYSKEGHVNCKDAKELKELMQRFFHNVFIFSMNDEVVHTGFYPMAHYLFALCVGRKGV
jgi:cyclopropane fatty-acyl-phospholipid synthase-like methyltransferase